MDDGAGLGLTMDMCDHERIYIDSGCPKLYQFQWWRMMKACRLPSSDLRNYEINELFYICQGDPPDPHYLKNLLAIGSAEILPVKEAVSSLPQSAFCLSCLGLL